MPLFRPADRAARAKKAAAENFPVAGWFLARRYRPLVQAYYAFARAADNIADAEDLTVIQKLAALDALEKDLLNNLGPQFSANGIPMSAATELLIAFRQDARNSTFRALDDLLAYCRHSAVPAGRFLLALYGENRGHDLADALCIALQILDHVQDVRYDAERLKRCYIPLDWLNDQDIDLIDVLDPQRLSSVDGYLPIRDDYVPLQTSEATKPRALDLVKFRTCLDRLLDEAERQLTVAEPLPARLSQRSLKAQSALCLALARRLLVLLRAHDPWQYRITLRAVDWAAAAVVALHTALIGR
jgi:phytoene/squalene synthetase